MIIYNNGETLWPTREIALRFSDRIRLFYPSSHYRDVVGELWTTHIKRNSEAFKANRRVSRYIYKKGLSVAGAPFVSLQRSGRSFFSRLLSKQTN